MQNSASLIEQVCDQIKPIDQSWLSSARERQQTLTKPPGSLGRLEEIGNRVAAIQQTVTPQIGGKRIYVVAADHGVTTEGVSAYPRAVTAQMVDNYLRGGAAINVLARSGGVEVKIVDAGVDADLTDRSGLIHLKIMRGTANFVLGPAMTRAEAEGSILAGISLAVSGREEIDLLGIGEMGIGNTTAASAIAAALTGHDPASVTGRGTGIDDAHLTRKIEVIRQALAINQPNPADPIDVLAKVGGVEIGLMTGIVLGAAAARQVVVTDGFISTAAAALAIGLASDARGYLFAAHRSSEPGHTILLDFLSAQPLLDLSMRLGEGTGAALAIPIIEAAARLLSEMATFQEAGVSNKE
jgi:nicotinate-nucleotide--dimethylbenzimidazole phosphoribosyltransferase